MALTCPTCRTENRDAAKFCKGCGGKLVTLPPRSAEEAEALDDAWGATVVAALEDDPTPWPSSPPPSPPPSPRASRPAALQAASVEPSPARGTSRPLRRHRAPPPRDRSVFWVLLAAATIVVATGGLYVYRDQHRTPLLTVVQEPAPASPAGTSKSPVLPITGAVTSAEGTAPAAPAPAQVAAPAAAPAAAVASAAVAARKPRKAASAVAAPVAPPPVAAAPVLPATPAPEPVASPPPPADPGQACAGRGFIATSQCLVAQCAKPEFSAHARCDAVRQQQRIDEEKRNPSNAA